MIFDLDGTICFDGRTIAEEVLRALRDLSRRTAVGFASARPIRDMLPLLPSEFHEATLIGGNGSFVRHEGRLTVATIPDRSRSVIDEFIEVRRIGALIDGHWDYAFSGDESHHIFRQLDSGGLARNVPRAELVAYTKVVLFTTGSEVVEALREEGLSVHVHPAEGLIDISPERTTKHEALVRVGIAGEPYIAFGNDTNDVQMLRNAATSYCVGGHPELGFADHHLGRAGLVSAIDELLR